jgi:hypothetical protein
VRDRLRGPKPKLQLTFIKALSPAAELAALRLLHDPGASVSGIHVDLKVPHPLRILTEHVGIAAT